MLVVGVSGSGTKQCVPAGALGQPQEAAVSMPVCNSAREPWLGTACLAAAAHEECHVAAAAYRLCDDHAGACSQGPAPEAVSNTGHQLLQQDHQHDHCC